MKSATLTRTACSPEGTIGTLAFGDKTVHTIELPWEDNHSQHSCIPPGTYKLIWAFSPKHSMCYHVQDVPGRSDILIHPANFGGDIRQGFDSDLLGCIAPVTAIGKLMNKAGNQQTAGLMSRMAVRQFEAWGAGEPISLTIKG